MSEVKDLVKAIVDEVLQEQSLIFQQTPNVQGVVLGVNADGTVNVQTSTGEAVVAGSPKQRTVGEIVLVVTADGRKVAL